MRKYVEVDCCPSLEEMLREISNDENVSKQEVCDILSAICDGVSLSQAVSDFWKDIDGYMYRELIDTDYYTDYADEA